MGKLQEAASPFLSDQVKEEARTLARHLLTTPEEAMEIVIAFAVWKKYGNAYTDRSRPAFANTIMVMAATNDLKNIMRYATRAQRAQVTAQLTEFADIWMGRRKPPKPKGGVDNE